MIILTKQAYLCYFKCILSVILFTVIVIVFALIQYSSYEKKNISGFNTESYSESPITIIIDAGHGGRDSGAVGLGGSLEKDINLAISQYIGKLFELTNLDIQLTRRDDALLYKEGQESRKKFYDLYNRIEFSKQFARPVFVSIHQNKFPSEKYKGLQVYYSKNHDDSKKIAMLIQDKTKLYLQKDNNRKIKEAGKNIFLLKNIQCPALLVECGFLSNKEDEKNLNDEEYKKKIAFIIFSALLDYVTEENVRMNNEV